MAHIYASVRKDVILGGGDSPTDDVLRMHTFLVKYNATDDGASHLSSEYGMKMRIISAAAALTHLGVEDLPVMPPSSFGGKIDEILGNATVRYCGPDAVAAGKGGDIYTPGRLIKFKDTPLRHLLCRVQPISLHGNRLEPKAAPPNNTLQWLQQHDLDGSATSGDSTITDDQRARMTAQQAAALQIQKQREQTTNTTAKSDGAADHDARTALVAEQKANVERIAKMQDQLNNLMDKMPSVTSTHDELRQQRELERERFAQERDERQQRERLRGFTKFAGFAALQMIILVIAFASQKYFTKAGAALPLACITAITAPMVHATCVFFLTVISAIRRQANSSRRPWLSVRSQDRARCKSNLSLYHLLVDGGPTWVKVAYVILRFFRVIPFKCITISTVALYSIQSKTRRITQVAPMRAGLPAGTRRGLPPDMVWHDARHLTPPIVSSGRKVQHAHAPLGLRCRILARRTSRGRGCLLPTSTGRGVRDYRQRWTTHGMQNRKTSVRHGTGRSTLAAHTLPVARGVRFYPTLAGQQCVHFEAYHGCTNRQARGDTTSRRLR